MRIYLDICCLKRPFDDQAQSRIHLETEAVLSILSAPTDEIEFIHGPAHDLENDQNPLPQRAGRVRQWLEKQPVANPSDAALTSRTAELMVLGFKNFDAFHLACAELDGADVLSTCDDRFLATARRHASILKTRVLDPVELARELFS